MMLLLTSATTYAQPQVTQRPEVCPPSTTIVCGVVAGQRQSYWNECLARRDGAIFITPGECAKRRSYE